MAIDLGSSNTTRYHSVPDSADFTLPNGDWAWITLVYPQDIAATKYIVSTGAYGGANSFNLIVYSNTGIGVKVDALTEVAATTSFTLDKWHWIYATRRSGSLYTGIIPVGGSSLTESTGLAISAGYNSATGPNIGRRTDGTADRYWKGRWGQVAFVSGAGITAAQAAELAKGASLLSMPFAPSIKALWHGRNANDASITGLIGGHVATRQGTSYGTSEEDIQTPYVWVPEYSRGIASAAAYTLTADPGSFAVTGAAATLKRGYTLSAAAGSFAVSGANAALKYNRALQAGSGSAQLSGTDASLEYNRVLSAESGAIQIIGTDATLTYTQPGNYTLSAAPGSFGISGAAAILKYNRRVSADSGSFAFAGTDATLRYARAVIAEAGAFAITGTDATLTRTGGPEPISSIVERTAVFQRSKSVTVRFN